MGLADGVSAETSESSESLQRRIGWESRSCGAYDCAGPLLLGGQGGGEFLEGEAVDDEDVLGSSQRLVLALLLDLVDLHLEEFDGLTLLEDLAVEGGAALTEALPVTGDGLLLDGDLGDGGLECPEAGLVLFAEALPLGLDLRLMLVEYLIALVECPSLLLKAGALLLGRAE